MMNLQNIIKTMFFEFSRKITKTILRFEKVIDVNKTKSEV